MAAVNITHTVKSLNNTNLDGIPVIARLKPFGFRGDDSQIAREQKFVTIAGAVTMNLEINTDVDAARPASYPAIASWYEVEVQLPEEQGGPELFTIRATAAQSLHDSIVAIT